MLDQYIAQMRFVYNVSSICDAWLAANETHWGI
jgi:hypothetical protein